MSEEVGWASGTLIELAEFHNGASFGPSDWSEDGLQIIRIEQLNNTEAKTDKYDGTFTKNIFIEKGDLVFSWSATLKVVLWAGSPGVLNQHLYKVVPRNGVCGELLLHILDFHMDKLAGQSQGSTMRHVTRKELSRFKVCYPRDFGTQERVASVLRSVDQAIQKTETLIEKYQKIKTGLMHDLFTRGIGTDGKLRPPREEAPGLYQETANGWIPREWASGCLLDVCDSDRQPILTGPFGADLSNSDFVEDGVPLLRIGNVQAGQLSLQSLLFVSEQKAKQLARYKITKTDLLFARQGATTGRNCLADSSVEGWLINYHIIRVALDSNVCFPVFIEGIFNSHVVQRQIERDKGRGTREGINTQQLLDLVIPLPGFEEQRRMNDLIRGSAKKIELEERSLASQRAVKSGLMQDLLTGRVSVPTPAPESTAA
jgi:type I restriction enzyme S subunit